MNYRLTLLEEDWLGARTACERDLQTSKKHHDALFTHGAVGFMMRRIGDSGRAMIGAPDYKWAWEKNVLDFMIIRPATMGVIKIEAFDGTVVRTLSGYGKCKIERVEGENAVLLWEGEEEITDEELAQKFPASGLEMVKGVPKLR